MVFCDFAPNSDEPLTDAVRYVAFRPADRRAGDRKRHGPGHAAGETVGPAPYGRRMDDNEYPPEQDRRPHTHLDRHFTSGGNTYQLTATGTGDERIRLTLAGRSPGGEVVSEISGGIPPADLPAVAEALTTTLEGLATLRAARRPRGPATRPKRYPNRGARWSPEDDERLIARHREGAPERALMEEFGRSRGGIRARLESLGELPPPPEPDTPGYPPDPDTLAAAS